jgi:hypothetical protein
MIDNLALGISHGLMMLAAFYLLKRPDLDSEAPAPRHWRTRGGDRPGRAQPGTGHEGGDQADA